MNVLLFGIAKDIVGTSLLPIEEQNNHPTTVKELKEFLVFKYPKFQELSSLAIAVNSNYATDETNLNTNDEIAVIPPVSGG